jgi:endonuclease/exonuclease/phosphatase family metal-dependent hydrolase
LIEQEVYQYEDSHLPFIAKALKMNFVFGVAFEDNFGNAILSKYQIQGAENHKIEIENNEIRSLVLLKTPYFNLNVTHLDVISEEVRLKQYEKMLKLMDHKKPNIFMGDFNSLRFEDYSTENWRKIEKVRKEKNWELPQTDLIREVEKSFYDVWSTSTDQEVSGTCRFNTRIDYIFISKENNFKIQEFKKIVNDEISDHYPLFMKFKIQ